MTEEEKQHIMNEFETNQEATIKIAGGKEIKLNKDYIAFEILEKT